MNKKIILIFFICSLFISFQSFFAPVTVKAIVDGDWYKCIFDDWAISQVENTEYVSGTAWVDFTATQGEADIKGVQIWGAEKVYQHGDVDNNEYQTVRLDLKQNYINISYIVYFHQYAGSPRSRFTAFFNRSDDQQLFKIRIWDNNDPFAYRQAIVYDENDAQEAASGNGVNDEVFFCNISLIIYN